jgi:hypothetical protein
MKYLSVGFIAMATVLVFCGPLRADLRNEAEPEVTKLVQAVEDSDYDSFVRDGDASFKSLPRQQFAKLSAQLGPRLRVRHTLTYMGTLKQHGFDVSVWKISFSDGSDDMLATLSIKDGKIGGFWFH